MKTLLEIAKSSKIIAHRGMFDRHLPENSLGAFRRAVEKNYAIELDVHLTSDGELVVFHDHSLRRMCGIKNIIEKMTLAEIIEIPLKKTTETIPSLKSVLELVNGKVALYLELKCADNALQLANAVLKLLKNYKGDIVFVGFEYTSLKFLQSYGYPVCMSSTFLPLPPSKEFMPNGMLTNISFSPIPKILRKKYPPFISWTVSTPYQKLKAKYICPAAIYNTKNFKDLK